MAMQSSGRTARLRECADAGRETQDELAVILDREVDRGRPRAAGLVGGRERHVEIRVDDGPREGLEFRVDCHRASFSGPGRKYDAFRRAGLCAEPTAGTTDMEGEMSRR